MRFGEQPNEVAMNGGGSELSPDPIPGPIPESIETVRAPPAFEASATAAQALKRRSELADQAKKRL